MSNIDFDTACTLDQLEKVVWGPPNHNSHLVKRCHELRSVPIKDFEAEDLRIMLGQSIGVRFLLPLALVRLAENPLLSGDMYSGDLLQNVIQCNKSGVNISSLEHQILSICSHALDVAQIEAKAVLAEEFAGGAEAFGMTKENYNSLYQRRLREEIKSIVPLVVLEAVESGQI